MGLIIFFSAVGLIALCVGIWGLVKLHNVDKSAVNKA